METLSAVVDTSVFLRAENGDVQALDHLERFVTGDAAWGVVSITLYEVLCKGSVPAEWRAFFRELFATCEVLSVTEEIALAAAEVNSSLRAPLKAPDALIAAAASAAGAVLVTADKDFLRLPGLAIELVRPS